MTEAIDSTSADATPSSAPHEYEALYQQFRWHVPAQFNIAEVCSSRGLVINPASLFITKTRPVIPRT